MPDAAWWDWPDRCRVERHLDGDTLEATFFADADAGFRTRARLETRQIVRLYGIDADEKYATIPGTKAPDSVKRARARDATAALAGLLPSGGICTARTMEDRDARGRWLGVFMLQDGRVVNDLLLATGLYAVYGGGARG